MHIYVDADACPVKEIIVAQAKRRAVPVTMVTDTSHELLDGYSRIITVDKARDSADFKLINLVCAGDIVVTQDYGVAAMALSKRAHPIHPSGMLYTVENIDQLLFERHLGQKVRRSGGRTRGNHKRTAADDAAFEQSLCSLLETLCTAGKDHRA